MIHLSPNPVETPTVYILQIQQATEFGNQVVPGDVVGSRTCEFRDHGDEPRPLNVVSGDEGAEKADPGQQGPISTTTFQQLQRQRQPCRVVGGSGGSSSSSNQGGFQVGRETSIQDGSAAVQLGIRVPEDEQCTSQCFA